MEDGVEAIRKLFDFTVVLTFAGELPRCIGDIFFATCVLVRRDS